MRKMYQFIRGFAALLALLSQPLLASTVPTAAALIRHYQMARIPDEGPWFTLTYQSSERLARQALPERYDGERALGSAIIGLLTPVDFSALHRLKTDEMWHYYAGSPCQLLELHADGSSLRVTLGPNVLQGQQVQHLVPQGSWMGAVPLATTRGAYTLIGNTLAPGFEYSDFEMGYRDELVQRFPSEALLIGRLTRKAFAHRP